MHDPSGPDHCESSEASRLNKIEAILRRREMQQKAKIAALLAIGIPALFLGPFILSSMYWALAAMWHWFVPWTWVFLGSCVLLIPLLFRTERKSGGDYYAQAVLETHSATDTPYLFSGFYDVDFVYQMARRPRDDSIGLVELFLWGPRQILEATRTARGLRQFAAADRRRAGEMLIMLDRCDHADVAALGGDAGAGLALGYLIWFGWIAMSKDKRRVWIESESRTMLDSRGR